MFFKNIKMELMRRSFFFLFHMGKPVGQETNEDKCSQKCEQRGIGYYSKKEDHPTTYNDHLEGNGQLSGRILIMKI
jgi:hypothetical protein